MEVVDEISTGMANDFVVPKPGPLRIFPRKKSNLFGEDGKVISLLPADYPKSEEGYSRNLKEIEYNFYPDLNTNRTITAYVTRRQNGKTVPHPGQTVHWKLGDNGPPNASLNSTSTTTDAQGLCEVVVEHPKETPPANQSNLTIMASLDSGFADYEDIILRICRNDDIDANLTRVVEGKSLLVCQSANYQKSEGVKTLQNLLNQVVARHKAATSFRWLSLDSEYGSSCRTDVKEFIERFKGTFDYDRGHFDIKFSDDVKKYIEKEYGSYTEGEVVDRDLLIGSRKWQTGNPISQIDGLLDIYEAVVKRFFSEMVRCAEEYTVCNTFWLHRIPPPTHRRYSPGPKTNSVIMKRTSALSSRPGSSSSVGEVRTGDILRVSGEDYDADGRLWLDVEIPIPDDAHGPRLRGWVAAWVVPNGTMNFRSGPGTSNTVLRQVNKGDRLNYVGEDDADGERIWYCCQVPIPSNLAGPRLEGWISSSGSSSYLSYIFNDRQNRENWGTFGCPGVAYSYGGKDRPNEFTASLNSNNPGPSSIRSWYEYKDTHKPGKTKGDSDTVNWIGCDCSGFVKNCLTDVYLSDRRTRIISDRISARLSDKKGTIVSMKKIGRPRNFNKETWGKNTWPWTNCIPARDFIPGYARKITYYPTDPKRQWLQQGDLIANPAHIVCVADQNPSAINNQRDFQVYNAYGGDYYYHGSRKRVPRDKFIRKLIKMPFKWWGITLRRSSTEIGRVYFWS